MFRTVSCLCFAFLVAAGSGLHAEDKAATEQLPAALLAADINVPAVTLNARNAHAIRGQGGGTVPSSCIVPPCHVVCPIRPPCPQPSGPAHLVQQKTFTVTGCASGNITLFEGVVGEFQHVQQTATSTTAVHGNFGGLTGYIGGDASGALQFLMEGKALQESLSFTGAYQQAFNQVYSH